MGEAGSDILCPWQNLSGHSGRKALCRTPVLSLICGPPQNFFPVWQIRASACHFCQSCGSSPGSGEGRRRRVSGEFRKWLGCRRVFDIIPFRRKNGLVASASLELLFCAFYRVCACFNVFSSAAPHFSLVLVLVSGACHASCFHRICHFWILFSVNL